MKRYVDIRLLALRIDSFEMDLKRFDDELNLLIAKEYKSSSAKIRKLTEPIFDKREKLIDKIREGLNLAVESGKSLGFEMKDTRRFLVELKLKEKDFRHLIDCRVEIDDLLKAMQGNNPNPISWKTVVVEDCFPNRSTLSRHAKNPAMPHIKKSKTKGYDIDAKFLHLYVDEKHMPKYK
ncbi:MAG: hypothetical protein ABL888_11250 [Pirellulaceae bacterium]